ncbi:T9SS type A sorting domain-containing protein [Taibaiella koreensis]|uniref:T9SS type A sorting domain-containing protein n=1 Tax=Taibaiella koreensis TaxID=1268548 RepID=UPI000E59AE41|nr:T9SS type A sorting domain-containing protein [Taibaiella koreensis]
MRRNPILWTLLLCLCLCAGRAKAQPGFDKVYSFSPYPTYDLYSAIRTVLPDTQRIFLAGITIKDTIDHGSFSGLSTFLAATDYSGNVQWQKRLVFAPPYYQSSEPGLFHLLAKVKPGKYVLGTQGWDVTTVLPSAIARPYLYFFKANGDSLKFVSIPAAHIKNEQFLHSILVDQQSNIVATGVYWDEPGPARDTIGIWLAKFDSSGTFLWRKIIVNPEVNKGAGAYKVIGSNDGKHYVLGGVAGGMNTINTYFSVWKTDTAGNVIWQKNIPKATHDTSLETMGDQYFDIIPASNSSGYYFMAADVKATVVTSGPSDYRAIYYCGKLDEEGKVVWAKTYQQDTFHTVQCLGLAQRPNGDLLFMGQSFGFGSAQAKASNGPSLLCTDSLGRVKWYKVTKRYDCPFDPGHTFLSMKLAPNGGIVRAGAIAQQSPQPTCFDTSGSLAWLVLTDSLGRRHPNDTVTFPITADSVIYPADTTTAIRVPDEDKPAIRLYPNPTSGTVYLELTNLPASPGLITVQLFDYMGRRLLQQKPGTTRAIIDLGPYPPGLYLLRLRYKDRDAGIQKVMKQ